MTEAYGNELTQYIRETEPLQAALFRMLEEEAAAEHIPILRYASVPFLRTLITMKKPRRVLEVGTAIGYSALVMLEKMPADGVLDTLELRPDMAQRAERNLRDAGYADRAKVYTGDAAELLPELSEPYDFIFLDAAKGQYVRWLPDLLRLLKPEGILLADNILQEGTFLLPRSEIPHRDRTIYDRLHSFMEALYACPDLTTGLLNIGDGMSLSVKGELHE